MGNTRGLRQQAKMILAIAQSFHDSGKKLVELGPFLPRGRKLALWAWRNMAEQWVDIFAGHDIYCC